MLKTLKDMVNFMHFIMDLRKMNELDGTLHPQCALCLALG